MTVEARIERLPLLERVCWNGELVEDLDDAGIFRCERNGSWKGPSKLGELIKESPEVCKDVGRRRHRVVVKIARDRVI